MGSIFVGYPEEPTDVLALRLLRLRIRVLRGGGGLEPSGTRHPPRSVLGPWKGEARLGSRLSVFPLSAPTTPAPSGLEAEAPGRPLTTSGAHYAEKLERLRI